MGRQKAGRIGLLSGRSQAAEQREAGRGPSTSKASGRPSPVRPDLLLTVGAFEGIFRPLEIGRHLGGRRSSLGVSELLGGPGRERGRRGTSASFHAPRQQSPAPRWPETEKGEPRDARGGAAAAEAPDVGAGLCVRTAPLSQPSALASRASADVAAAGVIRVLRCPLGIPRVKVRELVLRPLTPQARIEVGKVRFGSEFQSR